MRGSITSSSTSCRAHGVEAVDRLGAVGRHLDPEALALERDAERVAVRLLVVDDEDQRRFGHQRDLLGASIAARTIVESASGSTNRKVEPCPSTDSTVTSPPCACATWRTIERPSPVPPVVAAAGLVDPVEALEDPLEVAARDADPVRRAPSISTVAVRASAVLTVDRAPRLRVLHRVVEQVRDRAHHLAPVARDERTGDARVAPARSMPAAAAAGRTRSTASSTSTLERHRLAARRLLRLDEAEVEQVVDDAGQPLGLLHDPLGERPGDRGVVFRGERLRQHLERADRRLELVADVGDEVAAHALDAVHLRHVVRRTPPRRAGGRVVPSGTARRCTHGTRRPEQLQLAVASLTRATPVETSASIAPATTASAWRASR